MHAMVAEWMPPRITTEAAQVYAKRLLQIRQELAEIRHELAEYDQCQTDDPADMASKRVADCLPELKSAIWWLTEGREIS